MEHFAGLTYRSRTRASALWIVRGKIIREVKVASEADALLAVLTNPAYHFKRIGLKAGSLLSPTRVYP